MNQSKDICRLTVINLVDINVFWVPFIIYYDRLNSIPQLLWDICFKNQFLCRRVVTDNLMGRIWLKGQPSECIAMLYLTTYIYLL